MSMRADLIRTVAREYLVAEYGALTVDDDPEWAGEAVAEDGFAFLFAARLVDAMLAYLTADEDVWRRLETWHVADLVAVLREGS